MRITNIAIAVVCFAAGFSAAIAWNIEYSGKSPEFYGALVAALVAASALIFGNYYRALLEQRRDNHLRRTEQLSEALDLRFWLNHAVHELEFVRDILVNLQAELTAKGKTQTEMPFDQFREVISAQFFNELTAKARAASHLPFAMAGKVTKELYNTFTATDRIFRLRGASEKYRPSTEDLGQYIDILNSRIKRLAESGDSIEDHLLKTEAFKRA